MCSCAERCGKMQAFVDRAWVQSAKPATAHAVNGSRYKAHVSVLPPEAAMLTEGTRTMVAGWAIKHHAALNTYLSPDPLFLYKARPLTQASCAAALQSCL